MLIVPKTPKEFIEVQPGKIYRLVEQKDKVVGWALYCDKHNAQMPDYVRWFDKKNAGSLYMAIEESSVQEFDNIDFTLRQSSAHLRGFIFLTEEVRVWMPQAFWYLLEECET